MQADVRFRGRGELEDRRDLARPSELAPQVRAMGDGMILDHQHGIAHAQRLAHRQARTHIAVQHHDAVMRRTQVELILGADHPLAGLAAQGHRLDHQGASCAVAPGDVHRRPYGSHGDHLSGSGIGGAADDAQRHGFADIDGGDAQLVGRRMGLAGEDAAGHHPIERRPGGLQPALDLRHAGAEPRLQLAGAQPQVGDAEEPFDPIDADAHALSGPSAGSGGCWEAPQVRVRCPEARSAGGTRVRRYMWQVRSGGPVLGPYC